MLFDKVERALHNAPAVCELGRYVLIVHRLGQARFYAGAIIGQLLEVAAHIVPVLGVPSVGASAVSEIIAAVKVPFSDICRVYAVVMQALTDGVNIVA